ncbi:unnamed protein product [Rangifer tarandus platyrhynchus]|uniref:Uncharacterized protein n=2 Tax=Rangifer tarandus platyrhynchus TaxID=3082113 RepID=A0AC59ZU94_RANTA|nr:unnamed protein product [Rangifer tarandus platyrhynchus]
MFRRRGALSSGKGATLPGLRVPGWERGWSQDNPERVTPRKACEGVRGWAENQRGAGSYLSAGAAGKGRVHAVVSGGLREEGAPYAPPRSAPPPPPARPPRGAVPGCGPRSDPEWFKGPGGPTPSAPGRAAPPAGTWSPHRPRPGAANRAGNYSSRVPAPASCWNGGRCPDLGGNLGSVGGGVGPQPRRICCGDTKKITPSSLLLWWKLREAGSSGVCASFQLHL